MESQVLTADSSQLPGQQVTERPARALPGLGMLVLGLVVLIAGIVLLVLAGELAAVCG